MLVGEMTAPFAGSSVPSERIRWYRSSPKALMAAAAFFAADGDAEARGASDFATSTAVGRGVGSGNEARFAGT